MKRIVAFIILIFSYFSFSKSTWGACNLFYRISGDCDPSIYNCTQEREFFSGFQCEKCDPSDCCEVTSIPVWGQQESIITSICYAPIGTPLPEPGNCGTLGNTACRDASGNPYCNEPNLVPVRELPRGWVCREASRTPSEEIQPTRNRPTECDSDNDNVNDGIQTALGCIPTKDTTQFVGWLLGSAIKIAGGIAFLLIIFGAIKILTSAGNPENVKAGQELITSALMGLLFIIFSLFLLQLIGVKILNIPGFGQ